MAKIFRNAGEKHYQVIVVGAGMAGITAAYFLAKAGIEVLLLERGPYPGSKSISGGAVYSLPTRELLPDFWEEAPFERVLVDQQYWLMAERSAVKLGFTSLEMDNEPYNRLSIMRAVFDRWYAEKAVSAGAELLTSCKAEDLICENGRVSGVRASGSRQGDIRAGMVILAQGANPMLAERAGLIKKTSASAMSLYVKEIIALPEEVINERFNLTGNRGAVIGVLGEATAGLPGTGSIYTFKEHVGINVGVGVKTLTCKKLKISELIAALKRHPVVEPLLRGGTTVEYLAHMIPEGGFNAMPPLVFDGMVITGDSGGLVNGTHGINLAMYSGKFAADTALEAINRGDFSRRVLRGYRKKLEKSFILKDMRANREVPGLFQKNPTLFADYIGLVNSVSTHLSMVYPVSRRVKRKLIRHVVLNKQPLGKLLTDALKAVRVLR